MIRLINSVSCGCIDYGNNNFYEVMKDKNGVIGFSSHEDSEDVIDNGDSYDCDCLSLVEFVDEVKDRTDFLLIMKEVMLLLSI